MWFLLWCCEVSFEWVDLSLTNCFYYLQSFLPANEMPDGNHVFQFTYLRLVQIQSIRSWWVTPSRNSRIYPLDTESPTCCLLCFSVFFLYLENGTKGGLKLNISWKMPKSECGSAEKQCVNKLFSEKVLFRSARSKSACLCLHFEVVVLFLNI